MQALRPTPAPESRRRPVPAPGALTRVGLAAGALGFGGGLSVLSLLRTSLVERRAWLTAREFDHAATVAQMLPGGAAANLLAIVGLRFHGLAGAALAYAGFILPGFACVLALAIAYVHLGTVPQVDVLLGGISAAVVGIVGALTISMVRTAVQRPWQMVVAGVALVMSVAGGASPGEIAATGIGSGLLVDMVWKRARLVRARRPGAPSGAPAQVPLPDEGGEVLLPPAKDGPDADPPVEDPSRATLRVVALPVAVAIGGVSLTGGLFILWLLFLRTGLGAYGGGFAIVPHLQATLVGGGLLNERQFSDAVAIAKITPGPVLLLATFIGYVRRGLLGAVASTGAVFAAPFALTVALSAWLHRNRARRPVRAALRGLAPAIVGTTAAAAVALGGALAGPVEVAIAVATGLTLVRFRANPALLLAIGGAARLGLRAVGF